MNDRRYLNLLLDFRALNRQSDVVSMELSREFESCIRQINKSLRIKGVNNSFMLSYNGVFFDSEVLKNMKDGDVITVLPIVGGG